MSQSLHAVIAGAGIGGLTAALVLARSGHRVTIVERAARLEEAGAGLQLSPNAVAILEQYGLLKDVMRHAMVPDALAVRSGRNGHELMRLQLGPVAEVRWKAPTLVIHRADLQRALLDMARAEKGIEIALGTEVLGFAPVNQGIQTGALADGQNVRFDGDILIGADGLHSVVRERLGLGAYDRPVFSGRVAWRATIPAHEAPEWAMQVETNLWLGRHAHLVHYPLRGGEMVNVVAIIEDAWRGAGEDGYWSTPGTTGEIQARFGTWHRRARTLIAAAREWRRWPLFDRNPVPRWSLDRVVLLGDAAHPVLPFLAQGACLAIEDAAAIAAMITRHATGPNGDVNAAIKAYEKERMVRAAEIRIASRRQGAIYHMGGLMAFARDRVMRHTSREQMMARLDWIYKYRV